MRKPSHIVDAQFHMEATYKRKDRSAGSDVTKSSLLFELSKDSKDRLH